MQTADRYPLLDRAPIRQAMADGIARSRGQALAAGVLFLRLRRLREVGVLFGYEVGDALMAAVDGRIAEALRAGDRHWRVGDDCFVLSLPLLRDAGHAALAAGKLVRTLQSPLQAGGRRILPVVGIGIALFPEHGDDPETLWRQADQACQEAGHSGDRYAFYSVPGGQAAFSDEDLHAAIVSNQLELHLQPILDLRSGRLDRCEALSRWNHPLLGPVPPQMFVSVAEQTGLIAELTRWGLNVALRHVSDGWSGEGDGGGPGVAVNVAVDALQQAGFVDQVLDQLRFWKVPSEKLTIEITESGLMQNQERCERQLRALREAGVGVAIDDFGTGYSSMAYLHRLPANELKIDRSLVGDMRNDVRARKLVASIIDVAHGLGMLAVAEGVEDGETLALLRAMECDHAQGYYIGAPGPVAEVLPKLGRDTLPGL